MALRDREFQSPQDSPGGSIRTRIIRGVRQSPDHAENLIGPHRAVDRKIVVAARNQISPAIPDGDDAMGNHAASLAEEKHDGAAMIVERFAAFDAHP